MRMKRISRILGYWACLAVFLLSACIENDFPYPTVKLYLTGLTVEGQVGTTLLSNDFKVTPEYVKIGHEGNVITNLSFTYNKRPSATTTSNPSLSTVAPTA